MPDQALILQAAGLAAAIAAAALLLTRWPWRVPPVPRTGASTMLGVLLGVYDGCWWLGQLPHWPPKEDQDRLLLLLLPGVIVVEMTAVFASHLRWVMWIPRLLIAAGAARLLLHGSVYLGDASGEGSIAWTPVQMWLILGGSAAALASGWFLLSFLAQKAQSPSIPLAIAMACGGASVTVMLSGYATGGQIGLPLAAALTGATIAAFGLNNPALLQGLISVGVVGLFGLVIIGRFFGELTTPNACLLFFAPLACWFTQLPVIRKRGALLQSV